MVADLPQSDLETSHSLRVSLTFCALAFICFGASIALTHAAAELSTTRGCHAILMQPPMVIKGGLPSANTEGSSDLQHMQPSSGYVIGIRPPYVIKGGLPSMDTRVLRAVRTCSVCRINIEYHYLSFANLLQCR